MSYIVLRHLDGRIPVKAAVANLHDRVLRIEEVITLTGISRSMIYKLQASNDFPLSMQLGERAVGWRQSDVEKWLADKRPNQIVRKGLPSIYLAGRMGAAVDNKEPGREFSCWRLFDVAKSTKSGELSVDYGLYDVLIADPEVRTFHGTNVSFLYSGPWKASGSYHGYIHGITSCSPEYAEGAAYRGALQGISRADIFVAYIDDLEAFGTLVEIGYARALNKRIVVVTPFGIGNYGRSSLASDIWFAIRSADRHVILPDRSFQDNKEMWLYAHLAVAAVVNEWYPSTALAL
jgi:prophage regulatory protein